MPRERIWECPDAMRIEIEEYFQSRWETRKIRQRVEGEMQEWEESYMRPPTMAGLALSLGVTRKTLLNYNNRDEFTPVLEAAKARIAEFAEEALYTREASNGARFALTVNHKYGVEEDQTDGQAFTMRIEPPVEVGGQKAIPRWDDEIEE